MTKITMRFVTTTDIPIGDALVAIRLTRSDYEEKTSGVIMTRLEEFHTDADGFLQVDLLPAKALYHVTVYDMVQDIAIHHDFIVPDVEDQNTVLMLPDLIVPPDTVLSSLPYDEEALAKIIQAKVEAIAARDASHLAATQSEASATAAATSATAASASKTAAANSATAALAAQTDAAQSATTATTAATTATTAKNDSLTYKDQAFQYMTNAQTAKGSAEGSAAAALASANSATNSATSATGAASTATGASTMATTARDQAVDARNTAVAAKDTASQKAIDAAASAAAAQAAMVNKLDKSAASVAPAVNSVPLANANGYMNPAWLDPGLPIQTSARLCSGPTAKYGYNYLTNGVGFARWIHIATIPSENEGGHENLIIRGVFNSNWAASTSTPFTIFMGVRSGFYVDWHIEGPTITASRIYVIRRADGVHTVYVLFPATVYSSISFDLTGISAATHATPIETTSTPIGTVVFDSGTSPGNTGYIAPRWRGASSAGNKGLQVSEMLAVGDGSITTSFLSPGGVSMAAGQERDSLRIGVGGVAGTTYPGCFSWFTSAGNNNGTPNNFYKTSYKMALRAFDTESNAWSGDLITVRGTGAVTAPALSVPTLLEVGVVNTQAQGVRKLSVYNCFDAFVVSGGAGNSTGSALLVEKHNVTNSSIRTSGTVNTMGNDYAEYIFKSLSCGIISPGQIVGITADNKVTDKWADAVMFSIKSTAPSFVGGDTWANDVGPRPSPQAGVAPVKPARRENAVTQQAVPGTNPLEFEDVVTEPGDTNEEWEAKMTTYTASVAEWEQAVEADRLAMEDFDTKLEVARARVDRIAIAGRVPVNVLNALPGDYIVPVQDGVGIKGVAVKEDDMTLRQYLRAVGQVITIEEDGRAYVMVKSV